MPKPSTASRVPAPQQPRSAPASRTSPKPRINGAPINGGSVSGHSLSGVTVNGSKVEPKILFQKYFKSIGPRTYAAQLKEAGNGNHFLVLTEGKRDPETGEVKKTRVFVYSEDFAAYFRMLQETVQFIKAHPVSEEIKLKRQRYWAKKEAETAAAARGVAPRSAPRAAIPPAAPVRSAKVAPAKTTQRRPTRGR